MLISFTGPSGSGKDTAYAALVKEFGILNIKKLSNSYMIKSVVADIFHLDLSKMDDFDYKASVPDHTYGKSVRDLLIDVGDGLRDRISPSIWADHIARKVAQSTTEQFNWIKTDDRYPEELDQTIVMGGILVYIEAPNRKIDPSTVGARSESHMEYAKSIAHVKLVNDYTSNFDLQVVDLYKKIISGVTL